MGIPQLVRSSPAPARS